MKGISMSERETYPVNIAGVERELEKFEVAPGVTIAILNILGDVELVQAASKALTEKLTPYQPDVLVTAEAKSIPLIYQLAVDLGIPYIVLRKAYKSYMGDALKAETVSITTGSTQTLFLDEKDHAQIDGRRVVLVDDVISTGSTLEGMQAIIEKTSAEIVAQAAIFTEGNDEDKWEHIVALGNLPVWISE
jgi:adenine/guanine phosphoribosyltransferase-like PRPP-binding protein